MPYVVSGTAKIHYHNGFTGLDVEEVVHGPVEVVFGASAIAVYRAHHLVLGVLIIELKGIEISL